jgi:hypothetical protein
MIWIVEALELDWLISTPRAADLVVYRVESAHVAGAIAQARADARFNDKTIVGFLSVRLGAPTPTRTPEATRT